MHVFVLYLGKLVDSVHCTAGRSNANTSWNFYWNPSWNLLEICSVKFVDALNRKTKNRNIVFAKPDWKQITASFWNWKPALVLFVQLAAICWTILLATELIRGISVQDIKLFYVLILSLTKHCPSLKLSACGSIQIRSWWCCLSWMISSMWARERCRISQPPFLAVS